MMAHTMLITHFSSPIVFPLCQLVINYPIPSNGPSIQTTIFNGSLVDGCTISTNGTVAQTTTDDARVGSKLVLVNDRLGESIDA
jgi:hypothetical protein